MGNSFSSSIEGQAASGTQAIHRKDGTTQATQTILRALICEGHIINDTRWVLALVRKRDTEHSFLLVEGCSDGERKLFRSDLFLEEDNRPAVIEAMRSLGGSTVVDYFWSYSASSGHGTAFIRLKELNGEEYDQLIDKNHSEYQSWSITKDEADSLFERLIEEANKPCIPYHIAGDHPSWISSASKSYYHNCTSWCQKIIQEVFKGRLEVGKSWAELIKRPSKVIRQAQMAAAAAPSSTPTP